MNQLLPHNYCFFLVFFLLFCFFFYFQLMKPNFLIGMNDKIRLMFKNGIKKKSCISLGIDVKLLMINKFT